MTRSPGPLLAVLVLLLAFPAAAAATGSDGDVLVRVSGDIVVGPNETIETLVLTGEQSHADIAGTVGVVVVVGGTLNLTGTVREDVVLVNAHATLHNMSRVNGSITSFDSTIDRQEGAHVAGGIDEGSLSGIGSLASVVFGIIFLLGIPIALLVAALIAVAFFPRQVRTIGHTLTADTGSAILTSVLVWFGLPFIVFLLFFTLIGIPLAFGIILFLLPGLWIAGFIASGVRLGDLILSGWGKRPVREQPYLAASSGVLLLILVGLLPIIGALVVLLAGMIGAGALVLCAWRAAPRQGRRGGGDAARAPAAQDEPWDPSAGGA